MVLVYLTLQLQQMEKEHKAELATMTASHKATLQRAHLHPYRVEGEESLFVEIKFLFHLMFDRLFQSSFHCSLVLSVN